MNFIMVWTLVVIGIMGTIIGAILNIGPIIMIKEGLKEDDRGAVAPGIVIGAVVYSLEIALILQFLYGK